MVSILPSVLSSGILGSEDRIRDKEHTKRLLVIYNEGISIPLSSCAEYSAILRSKVSGVVIKYEVLYNTYVITYLCILFSESYEVDCSLFHIDGDSSSSIFYRVSIEKETAIYTFLCKLVDKVSSTPLFIPCDKSSSIPLIHDNIISCFLLSNRMCIVEPVYYVCYEWQKDYIDQLTLQSNSPLVWYANNTREEIGSYVISMTLVQFGLNIHVSIDDDSKDILGPIKSTEATALITLVISKDYKGNRLTKVLRECSVLKADGVLKRVVVIDNSGSYTINSPCKLRCISKSSGDFKCS